MRFLPPRRWFQFHLSTWFVVLAIGAWIVVACRPLWTEHYLIIVSHPVIQLPSGKTEFPYDRFDFDNRADFEAKREELLFRVDFSGGGGTRPNPRLGIAAVAFVTFLAIKGVMLLPPLQDSPG